MSDPSLWSQATRDLAQQVLDDHWPGVRLDPRCPTCGEVNRPGASVTVTREQDGRLLCRVCAHSWGEESLR